MRERFILTFLFHLFALSLVLFPTGIKGTVVMTLSSIPIRVLDLVSFALIVCGSIYLYYTLFTFLVQQQKAKDLNNEKHDKGIKS